MTRYLKWLIFKIFISNIFGFTDLNPNLLQSPKKKLYYFAYSINIPKLFFEFNLFKFIYFF
jgi:hypothetical protein